MKQQTAKEIRADAEYWHELERYLPWQLYGFTYRQTAFYHTDRDDPLPSNPTIYLTGEQRDQILKAIQKGGDMNASKERGASDDGLLGRSRSKKASPTGSCKSRKARR